MTQCQKCGGRADAFLCRDCGQALVRNLDMIPWLATRLGESAVKLTALSPATSGPRRTITTEDDEQSPVPFNSWAHDLYDELRTVCMRWVRDLCDQESIEFRPIDAVPWDFVGPLPKRGIRRLERPVCAWHRLDTVPWDFIGPLPNRVRRLGRHETGNEPCPSCAAMYIPSTQDLSRWLSANYLTIMNSEDAGMCANEIHTTITRALTAINPRVPPAYRGPCPNPIGKDERGKPLHCGVPLYAPHHNDTDPDSPIVDRITCPKCKADHDTRVLEQQLLNDVGKYLMPASQIFQVMRELGEPVAKSTFYDWTNKRRLQPRGWEHKGRIVNYWIHRNDPPMFSIDDVRRLRRASDKPTVGSRR